MKRNIYLLSLLVLLLAGCKDFLERPPLTVANDETVWTNEDNVRLYANQYYPDFFSGFGTGFTPALMGYTFSDDALNRGNQSNFTRAVPNRRIWNMTTIRSVNIMIDRLKTKMQDVLTEEAYAHWMGIGRFFRAFRYWELAVEFGDVPYYDHVVKDTDLDDLYKPRTPRDSVMDAVYADLKFAMENVRADDGDQFVNRYVVAGFVSRIALFEGTWQKYYYQNNERAKKFLQLAIEAGNIVMQSGKYAISNDYRSLFSSESLSGNSGVVLYRNYDAAVGVTHSTATYCNLLESLAIGPTTALIKSYICTDGKAWQNSELPNTSDFSLDSLINTRDSRFEATFHHEPTIMNKASYLYVVKFIPRDIEKIAEAGETLPSPFISDNNETDYPVLRYAEVLLNYVEAKAELATLGGAAVTQDDLDRTINAIRSRPLAQDAIDRGVEQTAPLTLAELPDDPARDPDVPRLIWEIRRERRMEFTFEYSRFEDLKRWHQLDNMDTEAQPDLLSGTWINFPEDMPDELNSGNAGKISVVKLDGTIVVYDGSNDEEMRGFYRNTINSGRLPFLNLSNVNPYLAPVGKVQMDAYQAKGYELKQTEGWPQNN